MKYGDYHLPSGVDFSSITYEDIRWQYGVFRCNSTGSGRDKKHLPWDGVKTNLGEIEEKGLVQAGGCCHRTRWGDTSAKASDPMVQRTQLYRGISR